MVIKKAPAEEEIEAEKEKYYESDFYPDLTRGYIENRAFPYVPEVWVLAEEGKKIPLLNLAEKSPRISKGINLPPSDNVLYKGQIVECNLPPGENILHIYRWRYQAYYGGWQKLERVEIVKVSLAEFNSEKWQSWSKGHYGWRIVIDQRRSYAYVGCR